MKFNWADLFIIAVILLSVVISFVRGFVKEAISLATWVLAIYLGLKFSPELSQVLSNAITTPSVRMVVSFVLLFLAVLILGGLINFLVTQVVSKTGLSGTNRLIGSVFGFTRGVLLIGVIVLLARHTALPDDPWWSEAVLLPKFEPVADAVSTMIPNKFHKISQLILE